MDTHTLRESVTDAIRYWEPRRLAYNAVLIATVLFYFWAGYPRSKTMVSLDATLIFFLLAVLANVCYCAAYLVDIFAQASAYRDSWRGRRWIVFGIGLVFAAVLARFISMGVFLNSAA